MQPSDGTTSQLMTAFAAENGASVSPWTSAWIQISGYSRIVWTDENSGELRFQTGGSTSGDEAMRITSDGEVLIGSTTDQGAYKLQVTGDVMVSGNIVGLPPATATSDGNDVTLVAGAAGATSGAGGDINITATDGVDTGTGGNIILTPGATGGGGSPAPADGIVEVIGPVSDTTMFTLSQNAAGIVSFCRVEGSNGAVFKMDATDDTEGNWEFRAQGTGGLSLRYPTAAGADGVISFSATSGIAQTCLMRTQLDLNVRNTSLDPLIIQRNFTELARFTSDGILLLGTTVALGAEPGSVTITTGDSTRTTTNALFDDLVIENNASAGICIATPNTGAATISFADPESDTVGYIQYDHSSNYLRFITNSQERVRITSSGNVLVGTATDSGSGAKVQVNGNVEAPNVGFLITAEENGVLSATGGTNTDGKQWAFGNGGAVGVGVVVPFNGEITHISFASSDAATVATIAVTVNGTASAATISPSSQQRLSVALGTPLSVNAGDEISFQTTSVTTSTGVPNVVSCFYKAS